MILNLVIFLLALAVIAFSLVVKKMEVDKGEKIFLANWFLTSDRFIYKVLGQIKHWWSQVTFDNTVLIFSQIVGSIKRVVTAIKRRFDHKHSPFFAKQGSETKNKGAVSFHLKHVSDYKKSLRDE